MKYVFYLLVYILLILLHIPFTQTTQYVDEIQTQVFFCQEIDCPTILITLLEKNPQAQCVFYDFSEERLLSFVNMTSHDFYIYEKNIPKEFSLRFHPITSQGLMHHKFCIFNTTILTGSWNPTTRGSYLNDNYVLLLTHPKIAEIYAKELHNLQRKKVFPSLHLQTNTSAFSFYFCPQHNCEEKILEQLEGAKETIRLLSFTFTSIPLQEKLEEKLSENVQVRVVQEQRQAHLSTVDETLLQAGAQLRYDTNPYTMHGKVWIIDNSTLILGSYNPTKAATTKNNENLIMIENDTGLIAAFTEEFERIWRESR